MAPAVPCRVATHECEAVECVDEPIAGDGAVDQPAEALAGMFVDDGHDLDRSAVGGGVELEVDRPHTVGCVGLRRVRCRARAQAFASAALRHPPPLFAPEPLDLLVVDIPALATGIVIRGSKPTPWMVFGVLAQPRPQLRVRIGHGGAYRFSSLRCSVLLGHPAGGPLTHTHARHEVVHGRPPASGLRSLPARPPSTRPSRARHRRAAA